jgi:hypothetical protein
MNDPVRLRDTDGAARALLGAGRLQVPHAARQRALAFTGIAASVATTGTAAAAGATSLVKSVVVCVCLGTLGGGLASLAVSETVARWQAPSVDAQPAAPPPKRSAASQPFAVVTAQPASEPAVVPPPPATEPAAPLEHAGVASPTAATTLAPTTSSSSKPRASNLFEEQRIIESARAAVSRGDAQSALATLDGYARSYAQGQFGPEALALRIEALSSKGDLARARNLAADFRQRYPHHPLLAPVQTAVQGPPSSKR